MISEVTCEDNMVMMARYPDKFFDLANDDPPYFTGPEKRGFYGNKQSSIGVSRVYIKTKQWELPNDEYFNEVKRVSRNQIIWGANYFSFINTPHKTPRRIDLEAWIKDHPKGWIVWDKCNSTSSFNDYELAWTSFDRPTIVYSFMWNGMLHGSGIFTGHIMKGDKSKNQKRIHPTQKPVSLYKWVMKYYGGGVKSIIDNFLGSGSSRIAAYDLGFDFYACELDKDYFDAQEKRFKVHIAQQKLFTPAQQQVTQLTII